MASTVTETIKIDTYLNVELLERIAVVDQGMELAKMLPDDHQRSEVLGATSRHFLSAVQLVGIIQRDPTEGPQDYPAMPFPGDAIAQPA